MWDRWATAGRRRELGRGVWVGLLLAIVVSDASRVAADHVLYVVPGTDLAIELEGKLTYNPGGTATLRHPRGTLHFGARDLRVVKNPPIETIYGRKLGAVKASQDVDQYLELAKWALHNGLLKECKSLLSAAWKVDPNHAQLKKLAGLMVYLNRPVPNVPEVEKHAIGIVGARGMRRARSAHFLLLHDTTDEPDPVTRKTRAEMRLDLLETVYESYFLTFAFNGAFIRPPTEPLVVVLFRQHGDFLMMERRLGGSLRQVAGFYWPKENISCFYDSGTTPTYRALEQLMAQLGEVKDQARRTRSAGAGELIRFVNTLDLLIDISRESEDVSTVSHEALHHIAGNTELFPHDGTFVRWIHEGLASYFESAKLARWSGVGVVDEDRIGYYRALEGDPQRGSLDFIVSDLGFAIEGALGDQLPAYGQAWSLTHFLFNRHFDDLMKFYREVQKVETEVTDVETLKQRGDELLAIFDEVFGDRVSLELEWRRYMRSLRTDRERLAEESR